MGIVEIYDFYWNKNADPRTNNLPLVGSPVLVPIILLSYLYIVLKSGPEFMKDRKPYSLKNFVKCYNIFQIITNAYIVQQLISAGWFSEISVFCETPDFSYNPGPLKIAYTSWLVLILKVVDLIETLVFVLRKKDEQVSGLHLYHHISTILLVWLTTKYVAVAMTSFTFLVNCSIHVIMYTYYFLSTFGKDMQTALAPYKPLLTIAQMVQFIVLIMQNTQTLLPSCPVTKIPGSLSIVNLIINFSMFYHFYRKRYVKPVQKTS